MKPATVLVVGGAGYIGCHMVKELLATGARVVVLDNLSTGNRDLVPMGTFIRGSASDRQCLRRLFDEHRVDAVMHFAAASLVGESVTAPLDYYRNNVCATTALLDAMVAGGVTRFIFSSSAAVYGEPAGVPIEETHALAPTNPYGATKVTVERLLEECDRAYGLQFVSLRYFNAAGADRSGLLGERHDPETHLIPLVLKVAAGQGEAVHIYGTDYPTPDGTCIRDYVHVTDLARAHLLALRHLLDGGGSGVYNLGNSRGYSVREVVASARKVTGHPLPVIPCERRPGDPAVLVAASGKIRRELGWSPRFEHLEQIMETAWRWHRREAGL
jgi:UDP-glucose 4-epimerase